VTAAGPRRLALKRASVKKGGTAPPGWGDRMAVGEAVQTAPKCGPTYQSPENRTVPIRLQRQASGAGRSAPVAPSAAPRLTCSPRTSR